MLSFVSFIISFFMHILFFSAFSISFSVPKDSDQQQTKLSFIDRRESVFMETKDTTSIYMADMDPTDLMDEDHKRFQDVISVDPMIRVSEEITASDTQVAEQQTQHPVTMDLVSQRKVLRVYYPPYPSWAKTIGLESEIAITFQISAEGLPKHIVFETMSGYPELDILGVRALKNWRFAATDNMKDDDWSRVVFRFALT